VVTRTPADEQSSLPAEAGTRADVAQPRSFRFPRGRKRSRPENPHEPRVRRIITTQLLARAHFRPIDPARPSNTCDALRRRRRPASSSLLSKILFATHVRHPPSASGRQFRVSRPIWGIGGNADFFRASPPNASAGGVHASASLFLICVTGTTASYMHARRTCSRLPLSLSLSLSLSLFLFLPHTHTLFLSAFPVDAERQLLDDARTRVRRPRFRFPHVTGDRSESRGQLEVLTPRMQPRTRRSATHTCANTTLDCATSIPLARGLPRRRPVKVERLNAGTRTGESLATGRSSRAMSTVLLGCARSRRRCRRRRRRRRRRRQAEVAAIKTHLLLGADARERSLPLRRRHTHRAYGNVREVRVA